MNDVWRRLLYCSLLLRRLTTHCQYGAFLEEAIRDQFLWGLHSVPIQKRLLTEMDLTLSKAIQIALGMEAANRSSKAFKATEPAL